MIGNNNLRVRLVSPQYHVATALSYDVKPYCGERPNALLAGNARQHS